MTTPPKRASTAATVPLSELVGLCARHEKTCSRCKERLPLEAFNRDRTRRDGYGNRCRTCNAEVGRLWHAANRPHVAQRQAEWHTANREQACARVAAWRAAHPDRVRNADAEYYARHRERKQSANRQRSIDNAKRLTDAYVRQVLCEGTNLRRADIPQALVDAKREHLRLLRALSQKDRSDE